MTPEEINFRTAVTVYIGTMEVGVLYPVAKGESECKVCKEQPGEFYLTPVAGFCPPLHVCTPACAGKWVKLYA